MNYINFSYGWRVNIDALDNNFAKHVALFPEQAKDLQFRGPTLFIAGSNSDYIRYYLNVFLTRKMLQRLFTGSNDLNECCE